MEFEMSVKNVENLKKKNILPDLKSKNVSKNTIKRTKRVLEVG